MLLALLIFTQFKFNAQDYTDAAGLIVKDVVQVNVDKDFKKTQYRDYKIYIFNTRGREQYSDMFEKYSKKDENLELINAQTVLSDGTVLKPEKKAISDLGTVEGFLAPAYKDLRTRTVSYSGVEPDAVLEYESKKSSKKKPDDKYMSGRIVFRKKDPILFKSFKLKVPKNTNLKYEIFGEEIKSEEKEEGEFNIYHWWVDSMPRQKHEPNTIPMEEFAPRILYTSFKDWNDVGKWLWEKFEESIVLSREIKERAKVLDGKSSDLVLKELYEDIAINWRDIPLSLSDVGYTPNKTDDIYKNRYGNQIDKVALLIALLKAAGYEAFPAYVSYSAVENNLPVPDYFELVLVAVPQGDGFIFLDSRFPDRTGSFFGLRGVLNKYNAGFPLLHDVVGKFALIVKPEAQIFITLPVYDTSIANLNLNIVVDNDGSISGVLNANLDGLCAVIARMMLRHKKEKEQKITVENLLGSIKTGTNLKNFEIKGLDEPLSPVEIRVDFECSDYLIKQGGNLRFNIPSPIFSFFYISPYLGVESCEYPFTVINARSFSYKIVATVPEDFRIIYMPEDVCVNNYSASATNQYDFADNTLKIEKYFAFNNADYQPEDYSELQSVYDAYESINQQLVLFRR